MTLIAAHIVLALVLFRLVNWIGEHATDFGYASTTLFEEPNESLALNFFIRALAPAVFMVALSAATVAAGHADLRLGIYWIAIDYYALRAIYMIHSISKCDMLIKTMASPWRYMHVPLLFAAHLA